VFLFLGDDYMITVLKHDATPEQIQHLIEWLKHLNVDVHVSHGKEVTVLGLIGDTSRVDMELLASLEMVSSVKRVSEPFKQANRKFHPQDSVIEVGGVKIGGGAPISVQSMCNTDTRDIKSTVKQIKKLEEKGCEDGHTVSIYDFEFEFVK
jgi:3-deoxy-7-phosphoheptulonate synthase